MILLDIGTMIPCIPLESFLYDPHSFHHYFNARYRRSVLLRLKYLPLLVITVWLVPISKSVVLSTLQTSLKRQSLLQRVEQINTLVFLPY